MNFGVPWLSYARLFSDALASFTFWGWQAVIVLVFAAGAVFWWALGSGQFEDLEGPAHRILADEAPLDMDQCPAKRPD